MPSLEVDSDVPLGMEGTLFLIIPRWANDLSQTHGINFRVPVSILGISSPHPMVSEEAMCQPGCTSWPA